MKKLLLSIILFSSFVMGNENSVNYKQQESNQQEQFFKQFIGYLHILNAQIKPVAPPEDDCDENNPTNNGRFGEEEGTGGHCRP